MNPELEEYEDEEVLARVPPPPSEDMSPEEQGYAKRLQEAEFKRSYAQNVGYQVQAPNLPDISRVAENPNYGLGGLSGDGSAPLRLPDNLPVSETPAADMSADFAKARAHDDFRRDLANVGRAFSAIPRAIGGTQVNDKLYDELGRARAVPALEQDAKMATLAQQERERREALDPASRSSRLAQAAFVDFINMAAPGLKQTITGEQISKMNRQQIEAAMGSHSKLLGELEKSRSNRAGEEARLLEAQNRRATLELDLEKTRGRAHKDSIDIVEKLLGKSTPGVDPFQDNVNRRNFANKLQTFRQKQEPTQKLGEAFQDIENQFPGLTTESKIPEGMSPEFLKGWFTNKANFKGLTSHMTPQQMTRFNSARMDILNTLRHASAGANLTEYEAQFWDQMFQSHLLTDPDAMAATLAYFRKRIGNVYNRQLRGLMAEGQFLFKDQWPLIQQEMEGFGAFRMPIFESADVPPASIQPRRAPPPVPTRTRVQEPDPNDPRLAPIPAPGTISPRPQATPATQPARGFKAVIVNKATGKSLETTNPANARKAQQDPSKYEVRILSE